MDLSTRQGRKEQGQRIQQAVERAGLSIEELAGRIGCSRALIYQYLSGSTLAQPDRLQQIATHCGVPLTYFYSEALDTAESVRPVAPSATATGESVTATPPTASSTTSTTSDTVNTSHTVVNPDSDPRSLRADAAVSSSTEVAARLNEGLRTLQELAAAQEGPPDYRALASTCERILSLAAQIGDRDAQARGQLDLGIALNKIGDFPRAVDALNRAVALAIETRNSNGEMVARQSLGRALTMMGRTEQARAQFQRIATDGDFDVRWRGLLSLGSLHEQQGEYQLAMARFDEAAALLEESETNRNGDQRKIAEGLLYVNSNRRNVYLAGGDLAVARELAVRCLVDAETLGNADQNLAARLDMGWCDLFLGNWAQSYSGLTAMLQLARFVGDQSRENLGRAALGVFLAAAGDFDAAVAHGKDALAQALSRGARLAELYAQLALADAYCGPEGRAIEARYHANQALAITTSVNYARSEVECRLRLARIFSRVGDTEGLRDASVRALRLAQNLGARHLESLARFWHAEAMLDLYNGDGFGDGLGDEPGIGERAVPEPLEAPLHELDLAEVLATDTGCFETLWRSQDLRGRIAARQGDLAGAENALRNAVALLEKLRESLLAGGIPDTLLENEDCLRVYIHLIDVLKRSSRNQEIYALLETTGWPPLTARVGTTTKYAP